MLFYNFKNPYDSDAWLDELTASVNGKDVTDELSYYVAADKGETNDDYMMLDQELKSGDKIDISGVMVNTDTYDDIEPFSYSVTLE